MIKALKDIFSRFVSEQGIVPSGLSDQYATRRSFQRFVIKETDLLTAQDENGQGYRTVDLSYRGCLLEPITPQDVKTPSVPGPKSTIVFKCLGLEVPVIVLEAHVRRNGIAILFASQEDASLVTLSHLIEPLRCGSTSVIMKPQTTYNEPIYLHRKRFIGDGPFDLVVERDQQGDVSFVMGSIRINEVYGSVILEKGHLVTKKSIDKQGVGARMLQTKSVDQDLVTLIFIACISAPFHEAGLAARAIANQMQKKAN